MTLDRERTGDELIEDAALTRAHLAAVTARLNWFVMELQRELELDDEDQETDGAGGS
jgi:hypothetical protein